MMVGFIMSNYTTDRLDALNYALSSMNNTTPRRGPSISGRSEDVNNYITSTPIGENIFWQQYQTHFSPEQNDLLINNLNNPWIEPSAKDYRDFIPRFQFYWDKFKRENIQNMIVYAPRRSGKSMFLQKLFMEDLHTKLGCKDHRSCRHSYEMIQDTYRYLLPQEVKNRIFMASVDDTRVVNSWRSEPDTIFLIDEYEPHMRNVYDKRCFILCTPTGNRTLYDRQMKIVNVIKDYQRDLEEYESEIRRLKYTLPEELFRI